jgi:hypothetical protein
MDLRIIELIAKVRSGSRSERIESFKAIVASGINPETIPSSLRASPPDDPNYIKMNLHIHTSESFGVFQNATEAVLEGYIAGLKYMGINDHYTIAGHQEFKEACIIAGIKPLLSVEAIAQSPKEAEMGLRLNDPTNPGRCYLSSKGVSKPLIPGNEGIRILEQMRELTLSRNNEIAKKISDFLQSEGFKKPFHFDLVLSYAPKGNVTERHLALALCKYLEEEFKTPEKITIFMKKFWPSFNGEIARDSVRFQNYLREVFVKVGGRAYVEESKEAFIDVKTMLKVHLEMGGIPSYSLIGSPLTEMEKNIPFLFDWLEEHNIFAVDVFPDKIDFERLKSIVDEAKKRHFPVFIGTEHNTKDPAPLVAELSCRKEFNPYFIASARLLLGHQIMSEISGLGFLNSQGYFRFPDREKCFILYSKVGLLNYTDKALSTLEKTTDKMKIVGDICSQISNEMIYISSIDPVKLDFNTQSRRFSVD